jgi:hypothetical protein
VCRSTCLQSNVKANNNRIVSFIENLQFKYGDYCDTEPGTAVNNGILRIELHRDSLGRTKFHFLILFYAIV